MCVAIGKHTGRAPNSEEVRKKAFSATFRAFFSTKPGYHKKSSGIHDLASNTISQLKKRNIIFAINTKKSFSLCSRNGYRSRQRDSQRFRKYPTKGSNGRKPIGRMFRKRRHYVMLTGSEKSCI